LRDGNGGRGASRQARARGAAGSRRGGGHQAGRARRPRLRADRSRPDGVGAAAPVRHRDDAGPRRGHDRRGGCLRRGLHLRLAHRARDRPLRRRRAPPRRDRRAPRRRAPPAQPALRAAARMSGPAPAAIRAPAGIRERLRIAPEVASALADGRPVVALESTLISHGFSWPENLEVARASEAAVRESGAVPASVAIHGGRLLVGLEDDELRALATAERGSVLKATRPSLAPALAAGGWAATTVSATMIAAHAAGITVFATGGIGGVHRAAQDAPGTVSLDISSDLDELARTPMVVVCAGPKAILDVPNTLEVLETR